MILKKKYHLAFILLIALFLVVFCLNLALGSVSIPLDKVLKILFEGNSPDVALHHIILNYRLPKAITSILVGAGLGVSGLLMQTYFRNPLAGPFVLGISSGASLGVAILIIGGASLGGALSILAVNEWAIVFMGALGSVLISIIIIITSLYVRHIASVLIIGLMFSSITNAIISVLSYFTSKEALQHYVFWGFGSLGKLSWKHIIVLLVCYMFAISISVLCVKPLNALLLGEDYAKSLGVSIKKSRIGIIVSTCILTGGITAFVGPIVFIGLAIPHITKQIFITSDHNILLPATGIIGAIIMLFCDTVAQVPNSELTLPINAITALVGAPLVIWLLIKKRHLIF